MKKLISGLLALTLAASGSAVVAGAVDWQPVTSQSSASNSVTLRWNPVATADGYRIYSWDQAKGKYVKAANISGKWKSAGKVKNLAANTSYRFVIKAYTYDTISNGGRGSNKIFWSAKSAPIIASTVPQGTSIDTAKSKSGSNSVRVFWKKVPFKNKVDDNGGATYAGYAISWYNKNTLAFEDVAYVSGGRGQVKLNGCKSGTNYKFKVTPYGINWVNGYETMVKGAASTSYTLTTKTYWCDC